MNRRIHIIGGGIAGLAAAVFAIRDGHLAGEHVTIYDEAEEVGGSLDASGSAQAGYVMRGERMLSPHFYCLFDLLSGIPSYDDPTVSAKDDILAFTREARWESKARLVGRGLRRIDTSALGLAAGDRLALLRLMMRSEASLDDATIAQVLPNHAFTTNFWMMWATMFAFQPWHSAAEMRRYLLRFLHLFPHLASMNTVHRTRYDQFHAIVCPLRGWLERQDVQFAVRTRITDMEFEADPVHHRVTALHAEGPDGARTIAVAEGDLVIFTNGSMTAASTFGSMTAPAPLHRRPPGGSWDLWRKIAAGRPDFGRPEVFIRDTDRSQFLSFTATTTHPRFAERLGSLTHAAIGREGLISFVDSNWLMTIKANPTPHFPGQPDGTVVWWGYGLHPDRPGNFVQPTMAQCGGADLMRESFLHLGFGEDLETFVAHSSATPCMMPFGASQFMPRRRDDRPRVVPNGSVNLAFVGQFCEAPLDTVFTVEYSVRTAMMAVTTLMGLNVSVPPVFKGWRRPAVLLRAAREAMR